MLGAKTLGLTALLVVGYWAARIISQYWLGIDSFPVDIEDLSQS
jgi:hypothetical protein